MERSPLKFTVTKNIMCLNPEVIAADCNGRIFVYLKRTLGKLVESNLLTGKVADKVKVEYSDFCSSQYIKTEMKNYCRYQMRLDDFWMSLLDNRSQFENLAQFVK